MKTCKKLENVLTDVRLVAEPPSHLFRWRSNLTPEKREQILKEWVSDFHAFIRDHRSADPVGLDVERVTKDLCSECESEWETFEEDGKAFCASCGAEVETLIEANDQGQLRREEKA